MSGCLSLLLALLATPCAADVVFPGYTTGLGNSAVYVLFSDGSDTAVQMTEGASLKAGTYTASDSAIATASLGAGTYSATIRLGDYSSPSASDAVVGVVDRFVWTGSVERDDLAEVYTDTNTTIPATLTTVNGKLGNPSVTLADDIDDVLTATGNAVTQTTAAAIRTALGMASADLDTQLDALPTAAEVNTAVEGGQVGTDAAAAKTASEAVEGKLPAGGKVIAAAGSDNTDLDDIEDSIGGAITYGAAINRKPDVVVNVQPTRADGFTTKSKVKLLAGGTYLLALQYPNQNDWLYSMTLPVSPDTDTLTVDSNAYGVNRNLAMVEVTVAGDASSGDEVTLPVDVQPTQGTTDKRLLLIEVIAPTQ